MSICCTASLIGTEIVHRQDSSPTHILKTVYRQNWRQITNRFEDSSPTDIYDNDGKNLVRTVISSPNILSVCNNYVCHHDIYCDIFILYLRTLETLNEVRGCAY